MFIFNPQNWVLSVEYPISKKRRVHKRCKSVIALGRKENIQAVLGTDGCVEVAVLSVPGSPLPATTKPPPPKKKPYVFSVLNEVALQSINGGI